MFLTWLCFNVILTWLHGYFLTNGHRMRTKFAKIHDLNNFDLKGIWFPRSSRVSNSCFSEGTMALPPLPIFWDFMSHPLLRQKLHLKQSSNKFDSTSSLYPGILTAGFRSCSKNKAVNPSSSSSDSFFTTSPSKSSERRKETTAKGWQAPAMFNVYSFKRWSGNDYSQEWLHFDQKPHQPKLLSV